MSTAGDQINGALRLTGQLAEGETASADTVTDALAALNQMLDSWSIERLSVYTTQDQTFTWPTSTATRTLGPSGDFVGLRPVLLDDSTYYLDAATGVSFGISLINEQQYNGIAVKTTTSTYPMVMLVNYGVPDITMTVFPVPTVGLEFHFISVVELTQPALQATTLVVPPGYLRAFRYNLACEIAAEFGIEPPPTVSRIAMASKRNIKRINNPGDVMSIPAPLISTGARFNIYSGAA